MATDAARENASAPLHDDPTWHNRDEEMARLSLSTVLRRLPWLVREAVRLAWQASIRDTIAALAFTTLAAGLTAFALLSTPEILTHLIEAETPTAGLHAALPGLLAIGVAATAKMAATAGSTWSQARLRPQVNRIAEEQLSCLTTDVSIRCFDDPDFCDSMYRARDRGVLAAGELTDAAMYVLACMASIGAVAGVLFTLHPVLLLLLFLAAVPAAWAEMAAARVAHASVHRLATKMRRKQIINELTADRASAAEVRAYGMRTFLLRQFAAIARSEQDEQLRLARRQAVARGLGQSVGGVGRAMTYGTLGLLLLAGTIPLAVAGTAILAVGIGQAVISALLMAVGRCYAEGLHFTDYLSFCALAKQHRQPNGGEEPPRSFQKITLRDVTFFYPTSPVPALTEVSIELNRGEIVALVGENGSGKSTLARILAGLYDPDDGQVCWDGKPCNEFDRELFHTRVALVPQDHTHWPLTARQNIDAGQGGDFSAVVAAAKAADIDSAIRRLPHGYDTLLDRRFRNGQELSGGQWQRIAVARGLYRDAPLLICDEPTTAMDARAEHALFADIRTQLLGHGAKTVLLITHRMVTAQLADRIYVLDKGRVIEQGSHHELLDLGGTYAELYNLQAEAYREERVGTGVLLTDITNARTGGDNADQPDRQGRSVGSG